MRLKKDGRGFKYGEFKDCNGEPCTIKESSSCNEPLIWLGSEDGKDHLGARFPAWMHVNRRLAKQFIRHLQKFVDTGRL